MDVNVSPVFDKLTIKLVTQVLLIVSPFNLKMSRIHLKIGYTVQSFKF